MAEPYNPYQGQILSPYEPTLRDRIAAMLLGSNPSFDKRRSIEGLIGSSGLGTTGFSLADMTGVGGLLDAQQEAASGNYRNAAMAIMPGAGPLKNMVNKTVARGILGGAEKVSEAAIKDFVPSLGGKMSNSPLASVNLPAGSQPQYLGAAIDRSAGDYPRYTPAKGTTDRMNRLMLAASDPENPLSSIFDEKIAKGISLKGPDWYNTEELRDWFVNSLGEKQGDAEWRDYMMKIGATSTGAKVPQNIRMASFYRALGDDAPRVAELVSAEGITPAEAALRLNIEIPNMPNDYNYGHIKQRNQASNISNQAAGAWEVQPPPELKGAALSKWLQANPKVKGFANDLLGNKKNIAADMHFMRLLAMADGSPDFLTGQAKLNKDQIGQLVETYGKKIKPYIVKRDAKGKEVVEVNLAKAVKDGLITDTKLFSNMPSAWADTPGATEYGSYENMAQAVAKRYDMTPAQFQASLWMGAGDLTNLADESQGTFMDLFRRSLDKRAGQRNLSREEMLRDFIVNKAPLGFAGATAAGAGYGLLGQPQEDQVY